MSSKGEILKPTFLAQFWGADYENLCYMAILRGCLASFLSDGR